MKRLPKKVRPYIEKAKDSALLAVEIYNKPAVRFKSNGYITLMIWHIPETAYLILQQQMRKTKQATGS